MHDCLAARCRPGRDTRADGAARALRRTGRHRGRTVPISRIAWDGTWNGAPLRCHLFAFEARYDGPLRLQPSEVTDGWWWTERELHAHLQDPTWPFVPDTRVLLADYLRGGGV